MRTSEGAVGSVAVTAVSVRVLNAVESERKRNPPHSAIRSDSERLDCRVITEVIRFDTGRSVNCDFISRADYLNRIPWFEFVFF